MKSTNIPFYENRRFIVLILALVPVLLYLKSLFFGFSPMDEQWLLVKNTPFLENWSSLKDIFTEPTLGIYFRPLSILPFFIQYQLAELNPSIYHFTNLLLHLTNIFLLYRFILQWKTEKKIALWASLIFAVHPLAVHAVAWVPGINDLVLCAFSLGSLVALKNYTLQNRRYWLILHVALFVCALLTKENAIVLPLLYAAVYLAEGKLKIKELVVPAIVWVVTASSWFFIRKSIINYFPSVGDLALNLKDFFYGNLLFTGKSFLPIQQSVFPSLKFASLIPGILATLVLALLWFFPGFKNKKVAAFGLLVFFIVLAIPVWAGATSGSKEHYEHRAYTSIAGLLLCLSQLRVNTKSRMFNVIASVIVIAFASKTFVRLDVYKSEESFTDAGLKENPGYYLFYSTKADFLSSRNDYNGAIENLNKALDLRPDKIELYNNRGTNYAETGKFKEAIEDITVAINGSAFNPNLIVNRCLCYNGLGDYDNAMKDLLVLRNCCRELIPPGLDQELTNKWTQSVLVKLNSQLILEPNNPLLYFTRGKLFLRSGSPEKALPDYQKAVELEPGNQQYQSGLQEVNNLLKK